MQSTSEIQNYVVAQNRHHQDQKEWMWVCSNKTSAKHGYSLLTPTIRNSSSHSTWCSDNQGSGDSELKGNRKSKVNFWNKDRRIKQRPRYEQCQLPLISSSVHLKTSNWALIPKKKNAEVLLPTPPQKCTISRIIVNTINKALFFCLDYAYPEFKSDLLCTLSTQAFKFSACERGHCECMKLLNKQNP